MIDISTGLFLVLIGMLAGFLVGLIGIGGGVVLVPALLFLWGQKGLSPEVSVRLAFGTSLLVAALTAISGVLGHSLKGRVVGRAIWPLALFGVLGAWGGATAAASLPGDLLRRLFGGLLLFVSYRILRPGPGKPRTNPILNPIVLGGLGLATGFLSALLGIGGGVLNIPVLVLGLGFPPQKVAGTSNGVIVFTAAAGAIWYVLYGLEAVGLPPHSWGYVHWGAALPLVGGSLAMAQLGALANWRANVLLLRRVFGVSLLAAAGKMLIG